MEHVVFKYLDKSMNQTKEINISLTIDDIESFKLYKDKADRLKQCRLVQEEANVHLEINYDKNSGLSINSKLPNDNDFAALLHFLRPFVLEGKKEIANFNRIANILYQKIEEKNIRENIIFARELFSGKNFQKQIKMVLNDEILNSDKILNKWLNSYEYHPDKDKIDELKPLNELLPLNNSKAIFISMVFDKVDAVFKLNKMISHILFQIENNDT